MRHSESVLDRLLRSLPDERERLRPYVDRAKALSSEFGCSMGGAIMVAALALVIGYEVPHGGPGRGHVIVGLLRDAAIVFSAGIAGKLIGLGIARVRLAWLYRELRVRYHA
jgi:hypothetical protein